jgi:thiol-disulfide isomerase/thioredoxin
MKTTSLLILSLVFAFTASAQKKKIKKPLPKATPVVENKLSVLPKFTLYSIPDSTVFTEKNLEKDKKTIFIYYGPDCGHCMVFAKKLMDSLSLFENTQIVMMSSFEFSKIKRFYEDYKMNQCTFLTMAYDPKYFFVSHFDIRMFPSAYVYSSKGKFLKSFSSEIPIREMSELK